IIIGGNFTTYKGTTQNRIVRLNADGTFDATFNIGTGFNNPVSTVVSYSDNKILVTGSFTLYNGTAVSCIVKLNTDGSIDNTFTPPTFNVCPNKITLQPDGKAIVTGAFTTINAVAHGRIARLNTDGSLDATFTTGTGLNQSPYQTILQPDGKIIVGGNFTTYNSVSSKYIVRLNSNGTVDNTFNVGTGFSARVNNVALLSNGKVVVGGTFTTYKGAAANYIALLDSVGNLDSSFIGQFDYWVTDLFTTADDKIITIASGNYVTDAANRLARLNSDGTFDRTFSIGTGFSLPADAVINSIVVQPSDSKILVGGKFTQYNGTAQNYITRLDPSGTRDASFNIGTGFNNIVNALALQADNKIIAGGAFTTFAGTAANRIARINSDGSLDSGFNIGTGFSGGQVYSIALQGDGKIIVGGDFTTFNGIATKKLARINSDGSLDTSFDMSTAFNSTVRAIAVLADQTILVGGSFTTYQGSAAPYLIKLLNNGQKDTSFVAPTSLLTDKVSSIAVQSDKKIVLGGSFSGTDGRFLARLNENGSVDSTFITSALLEAVSTANLVALDISSTGKILTGFDSVGWSSSDLNEVEMANRTMLFGW
ncbi:MAG: delta-60 repeat domain-containing protein, partial [Bdellovibrio sp.]